MAKFGGPLLRTVQDAEDFDPGFRYAVAGDERGAADDEFTRAGFAAWTADQGMIAELANLSLDLFVDPNDCGWIITSNMVGLGDPCAPASPQPFDFQSFSPGRLGKPLGSAFSAFPLDFLIG